MTTDPLRLWLVTALALLVLIQLQPILAARNLPMISYRQSQEIVAKKAVVAADDGRCAKIGTDVLKKGGNAVDAAVSTALCLGVVGQGSSGIGGGSFMIVRMANGTYKAFDMRDQAPAGATEDMYVGRPEAKISGGLSIAIPGELAGLHEAWMQFGSGKIAWAHLVQPAIDLAKNGFEISKYLYSQFVVNPSAILNDPGLSSVYTNGKNNLLKAGSITKNPKLAETLEAIAKEGPSVMYNGSVGLKLVNDIQRIGGIITMNDFNEYRVIERAPLVANVIEPGLEVITMPPPSSGGASFILMLNILKEFGIPSGVADLLGRHRFVEALKHTFGIRMNLGDPDFKPRVYQVVADMLSTEFARAIRNNISDYTTFNNPKLYGNSWAPIRDDGTSHFSIIDEHQNAVALTTSVNNHFGSLFLSPSTGILLNNQMDDFSTPEEGSVQPPAPANYIEPKKRPMSSMTPTIVLQNGKLKAVIGASGGPLIIIATTQVFLNHFGLKMEPLPSVLYPRVYHKLIPDKVLYENSTTVTDYHVEVPDATLNYLKTKHHQLERWSGEGAICQFVVQNFNRKRTLTGVSDPRKGGYPAGY